MSRGTANTGYWEHTITNLIFLVGIRAVIGMSYGLNYGHGAGINIISTAFVFATIWMSPDIDSDRSLSYKAWFFFSWYWWIYAYYMPHKGSSGFPLEVQRGIGHNLFWGTVIRLMYASPLFILIQAGFNFKLVTWLLIWFGIWLADAMHILIDFFFHMNNSRTKIWAI